MNPPPALALPQDFGDHFSPIVVKELRQGLRTRFFTYALTLFRTALILLLACANLELSLEMMNSAFWVLTGIMLLVVLPLRGFDALHSEAKAGTLDMLALTSMPAQRILQGKWAAIYGQTLLVACSVLPYMVARYFFGGVEIAREALGLASLVLGSGILSAALLAFSSQASLLLRLTLGVALGFAALPLGFFTAGVVMSTEADSLLMDFRDLSLWQQAGIVVLVLTLTVYSIWYLLAMGASRIAPASENHSTRKRFAALVMLSLLTLAGVLHSLLTNDAEELIWYFLPLLFLTMFTCMDVMTEEMPHFPTCVVGLQRLRNLSGIFYRLFLPGWASGVAFSMLLCLLTLAFTMAVILCRAGLMGDLDWDVPQGITCFLAAPFLPVLIQVSKANHFANWWVVQIILLALGFGLVISGEVLDVDWLPGLSFVTPTTAHFGVQSIAYEYRDTVLVLSASLSGIWMLAALVYAWRFFPLYRELEDQALSLDKPPPPPAADVPAA